MTVHGAWMGASRNVRPDDDLMEIVVEVVTATTVLEIRVAVRLKSPLTQSRSVVAPTISNRTRRMVRPRTKKKLPTDRKGLSSMTRTRLRTKCSKKGIDWKTTLTGKPTTCDQMRRKLRGWTPPVPTASGAASSGAPGPPATATTTGASSSGINVPIRQAGPKVSPMTPPRPTTTATMGMATPPMRSTAPHLMRLGMNSGVSQPQCPMHCLPMLVKRNRRDNSNFWACPMFPHCRSDVLLPPIEASEILTPTSPMSAAGEQSTAARPAPPRFPTPAAASAEAEITAQRAALTVEYERIKAMKEQLHQKQQITVRAQADLQSRQAEVSMQRQANLRAAAIIQRQVEAVTAAQVGAPTGMPSAGWPLTLSPQSAAVLQQMALEHGSNDIAPFDP